jgi:hypothetical protein
MKARPIEMRKVMNLTCSSSDASVATVDNNAKVTAVKNGTATITCKGLVKKIERSASSTVTVPAPAWTLSLTPASGSTDVGKTLSFAAKAVDADNADLGAVTWSSANASIASVSNGTVTCNAAGSTTITVTKTAYGTTQTKSATVDCKAAVPEESASPLFLAAFAAQGGGQRGVAQQRKDLVGRLLHIPEVDFERIFQHFRDSGLTRQHHRHIQRHRFQRRDAKGLGHRGHNIDVGHRVHALDLGTAQEARKVYLTSNPKARSALDHRRQHVTAA